MDEFRFDFSRLNALESSQSKISYAEITSIFTNENSKVINFNEFVFIIGFVNKSKFLSIAFDYKTDSSDIRVLKTYPMKKTSKDFTAESAPNPLENKKPDEVRAIVMQMMDSQEVKPTSAGEFFKNFKKKFNTKNTDPTEC